LDYLENSNFGSVSKKVYEKLSPSYPKYLRKPSDVPIRGFPIPAKLFLMMLYVICSKFFFRCKTLE
jgi:hypothetical protein